MSDDVGRRMHDLMTALFPLCRSITGDGVRETLRIVGERCPIEMHEVPSGTQVLDWIVPDEWNIRDAHISRDGQRVVDFGSSNLHVVGYSEPVHEVVSLDELRPRLHTHDERRDWTPYRTSYYTRTWGFCLSASTLDGLEAGEYEARVDATLAPGSLTFGEVVIPGERAEELLLTTHVCHPSLANDNLSGIALLAELATALAEKRSRYTYRLLFIPGTIGSITWLATREDVLRRVVGGLVVACVGDAAPIAYKRSRRGDARIDRAAEYVLALREGARLLEFVPWGWDERQFNSPGFDLPVGCLSRSREGEYPEYHSSADTLELVTPGQLEASLQTVLEILDVFDADRRYVNLSPRGEPQLGRRDLYPAMGGAAAQDEQLAMLWVLNQSDGGKSALEIAARSGLGLSDVDRAARALVDAGLLREA
jgi:aminopeptidase-like protein